jgi:4-cresol dehydrogenase (hydroxylating)
LTRRRRDVRIDPDLSTKSSAPVLLPPGVSAGDFAKALAQLAAAVGDEAVLTSEDDLAEFRDPFSFPTWDDFSASAVVMPQSVEEVQEIVRIANRFRVPLWTHGQGKNNGYGGPAPRLSGSVIVSLRKMNRVLEIDEECAYAVVEPGVRWFDLYEAIQAGNHRLMVSVTDLGWGSVVGNFLENGITYLPVAQDMAAYCGMEVVLANGEVMRTGMGAMPGNRAWHVYKRGLGPTLDQLFMQSNYGIVTKLGVWLMPWPECYIPLWLRVWNEDDLGPVVDTLRSLMLDRTIENVPQLWNTISMASVISSRSPWYQGEDPIPDDVIDRIARELEIGRWLMRFALYGDENVVDLRFRKIKEAFELIPGAEVWGQKCAPQDMDKLEHPFDRVQAGVPNLDINQMTAWYGGEEGGHIGFSPVARLTGSDATALRNLLRGLVEDKARLDYAAVLIPTNARSFVHITLVIFDTKDEAQTRRAYDTAKLLVSEAAKEGYGEYRAHLDFMDLAADQYSFGDHAYRRFAETIKDAVDPNGILSPGKQGIWPKAMRNDGPGPRAPRAP